MSAHPPAHLPARADGGTGPADRAPAVRVYSVAIDRACASLFALEQAQPHLSDEQEAAYRVRVARDRTAADAWRAAHIALRIVLEATAGTGVRRVPFSVAPGGRPYLAASHVLAAPPQFSISHSGMWALMAVAPDAALGVDIERPRTLRMTEARRSAIENAASRLAPHAPLPDALEARTLQAWVRLEAAAKATGEGIGRVLTKAGAVGGRTDRFDETEAAQLAVRDIAVAPNVYAAVAASVLPDVVQVQQLPETRAALEAFIARGYA